LDWFTNLYLPAEKVSVNLHEFFLAKIYMPLSASNSIIFLPTTSQLPFTIRVHQQLHPVEIEWLCFCFLLEPNWPTNISRHPDSEKKKKSNSIHAKQFTTQ